MKKILVVLLSALLSLSMVACSEQSETSNNTNNSDMILTTIQKTRYEVISAPVEEVPVIIDSATDNEYNYYLLDLGYAKNVPISSGLTIEYNGQTPMAVTFEKSRVTQESISNSLTKAVEQMISTTSMGSAKVEVKQKFGYETWGAESETSLGLSYSREWGTVEEKANSTSDTYTTASSATDELKSVVSYTIGEHGENEGCYRLSLIGTCDIYASIKTTLDNSTLEDIIYSFSARQDTRLKLEYDEDGLFDGYNVNKIALPENYYKILPLPEKHMESGNLSESSSYVVNPTNILNKTNNLTIIQDGYYGLQEKDYDVLDLSAYRKDETGEIDYFTKDYVFCFDVCVNISEKDDGYQEIYLYNQIKNTSKEVQISEAQDSYGMICGSVISHGGGSAAADHYDVWYVRGDQIKDTMYIRYDAHGDGDDTWYRRAIKVDLTIVTSTTDILHNNEEILFNDNNYTIGQTGYYGLAPGRGHEELDLSDYIDYMNEGYLFLFDVSIDLSEKDDGYQEIYLYNKDSSTSSEVSLAKAREYGLLTGKMLEHGRGQKLTSSQNYNFVLTTTGDNIDSELKKLYIHYDAWGDDTDTWYKEKIKVTLTIVKIPDFIDDSTVTEAYKKF